MDYSSICLLANPDLMFIAEEEEEEEEELLIVQ